MLHETGLIGFFVLLLAAAPASACPTDGTLACGDSITLPVPCESTCDNSCAFAYDGYCDDGGPGSVSNWCSYGSDCADCGMGPHWADDHTLYACTPEPYWGPDLAFLLAGAADGQRVVVDARDSVENLNAVNLALFALQGDCDPTSPCLDATDINGWPERIDFNQPVGLDTHVVVDDRTACSNTCPYSFDGDCDDGGSGSDTAMCVLGSDCGDCGTRYGTCDYTVQLEVACVQGCDPVADVAEEISCSLDPGESKIGSTQSGQNVLQYYDCKDGAYRSLIQNGNEVIYTFRPQVLGTVTFRIDNMTSDQDIYVLEDSCDQAACIEASTVPLTDSDSVTFTADPAKLYYIVVEAYGGEGEFTLYFDQGSPACVEDCNNGVSDDNDSLVDCDDPDCSTDPACACDRDNDGEDGPQCGGLDCDDLDPYRSTAFDEVCDGIDNDCSLTIDDNLAAPLALLQDGVCAGTRQVCDGPKGFEEPDYTQIATYEDLEATCDGLDNDCDGEEDEMLAAPAADQQSGVCAGAQKACDGTDGWIEPDYTQIASYEVTEATCDGLDNDCDSFVDEALPAPSADNQLGVCAGASKVCDGANGWAEPDYTQIPTYETLEDSCDGLDNDCDSFVDETLAAPPATLQHGVCAGSKQVCAGIDGWQEPNPAQITEYESPEVSCDGLDNDCDSFVDEALQAPLASLQDGVCAGAEQVCAGANGWEEPNYTSIPGYEIDELTCDLLDNDCDSLLDLDDPTTTGNATYYADVDDDGFGDAGSSTEACGAPANHVSDDSDCNDAAPDIYPGAPEIPYDGIDQDCDGVDLTDADGDGYSGDCDWLVDPDCDCDDTSDSTNPGVTQELADFVDQDCDGIVDEGTEHYDDDGDGVAELGGDCDDGDSGVAPGTAELCDGLDNDCDGVIDNGTACFDDDLDGYCEGPSCADGSQPGDCSDGDAAVNPGSTEVAADGIDNDCDGHLLGDEADGDGDGFTVAGGDCNDGDATINPAAAEQPDGRDDDCDGLIDEGTSNSDDDGDGSSEADGDCNDADPNINEAASEQIGNGIDDDCDGRVDEGSELTDDDGDGSSEVAGDCDDTHAGVFPGAPESNNGLDDDCDGDVDEDFVDADQDGYTVLEGDCDDEQGWSNPGLPELCDGLDNNCDGRIDETCEEQPSEPVDVEEEGCSGCSSQPGPGGLGPLVLLLIWSVRRERKGRS